MPTLDSNYPKGNSPELTDEQLKQIALQNYQQQEVKATRFPTEIIDLPSRGLFYPEGHPLASGKIEMKYMTAREEDILTSQNLIKQGVVLDKLFQSLIITPIKYDDLLLGDKNAIMIAARILGYGKDYEVEIVDPDGDGKDKIKVSIDLTTIEPKEIPWELITPHSNEFEFVLPASKRTVTFKSVTQGLDKQITQAVKNQAKIIKSTGIDKEFTTRLKYIITSVDGNRDQPYINEFVDNELFARDSRELRTYMQKISPDIDMKVTIISEASGEPHVIDLPIDVSFFWPRA